MRLKWTVIIPTLAAALVGGAAITSGLLYLTQPQEVVSEETPVQLEQIADDITTAAPLIQEEPQPEESTELTPPLEEESLPGVVQEEPQPEEEIPEEPPEEPEPLEEEADLPEESIHEDPQEEPLDEPLEEEPAVEDSNPPQPLDSDLYDLAGSYTSDTGILVDIQFADGFYTISFQGIADSHHTITDNSPGDGSLDLTITLTNLPFTAQLTRALDGTLTVALYAQGSTAPIMSATATKN